MSSGASLFELGFSTSTSQVSSLTGGVFNSNNTVGGDFIISGKGNASKVFADPEPTYATENFTDVKKNESIVKAGISIFAILGIGIIALGMRKK